MMRICKLKKQLHGQFEMMDLGPLRYFLGIEVASSPNPEWGYSPCWVDWYYGSCHSYWVECSTFDFWWCSSGWSYLVSWVGWLFGLSDCYSSRYCLCCACCQSVFRYAPPRTTHWAALLRILRYIRSTSELNLLFSSSFELRAYADADWAVG